MDRHATMSDPRYPLSGPADLDLEWVIAWAGRSPFFSSKLAAAGIVPGERPSWEQWRAIPPTTKDELRELAFDDEVLIAPRSEVIEYWRSGGVTGVPLYYPRTRSDLDRALQDFARALTIAGVTSEDTVMCSLPLGIHPAGQFTARAAEHLGAAVLWAGAGNQLASANQIELIRDFDVTVWCGMASFGLHLGHLAEAAGEGLAASAVRLLVTTAEPLSRPKRDLLSRLWGGAEVRDTFGMTEASMLGAECEHVCGLHMWTESSFCEVLDPDTLEPVDVGDTGVLCVTPKRFGSATPFIRWVSGDVVRMEYGCECEHRDYPRLVHSGRTAGFFKVKGVSINHAEAEQQLYAIDTVRDFRVSVTADDGLLVEIETGDSRDSLTAVAVDRLFRTSFGLTPDVVPVDRGTIARELGDQVKAQRFVDRRSA